MRAAQLDQPGSPAALTVREVPEPAGGGRVVIDVEAAGVGYLDVVCARGVHQLRPSFPLTPGFEVAGVVRESPEGTAVSPGDRVAAYVDQGGYAEVAAADPRLVLRLPDDVGTVEGAALPVNALTALYALVHRARVQRDEVVVVHGAAGGIGGMAVRIARRIGARVIAVVSSAERGELALAAGASCFVAGDDWVGEVRDQLASLGRHRADVVVDPVGGERLAESMRCLAPEGRLVSVGFVGGIPSLPVNHLLVRNLTLIGADWAPDDPVTHDVLVPALRALLAEGVRPAVTHVAPLDEAGPVLEALERRQLAGKAVLRP
jgi:NADPH2:quinone reductase